MVVSDPGAPDIGPDDACERPLDGPAMDFVGSATPDEQAALATAFNALIACLGLDVDPVPVRPAGEPARVEAAERAVQTALFDSPALEAECTDRGAVRVSRWSGSP